jgi:hypothetical protein
MAPYYKSITASSSVLPVDKALLATLEKANEEELKKLDERLAEAEKTEGESEISDALKARANYLTRIGDKVHTNTPALTDADANSRTGTLSRGAEARAREDPRPRLADRHRAHHRAHRLLLQRHRSGHHKHGQGRKVRHPRIPICQSSSLSAG